VTSLPVMADVSLLAYKGNVKMPEEYECAMCGGIFES
jgi:hypothetical protein